MGVTPKLFARFIRFDRAIKLHEAPPHLDWLSIAINLDEASPPGYIGSVSKE